jgi:hypothetical protein
MQGEGRGKEVRESKGGRETELGICQPLFPMTPMTLGDGAMIGEWEVTQGSTPHSGAAHGWSARRKGHWPQEEKDPTLCGLSVPRILQYVFVTPIEYLYPCIRF